MRKRTLFSADPRVRVTHFVVEVNPDLHVGMRIGIHTTRGLTSQIYIHGDDWMSENEASSAINVTCVNERC